MKRSLRANSTLKGARKALKKFKKQILSRDGITTVAVVVVALVLGTSSGLAVRSWQEGTWARSFFSQDTPPVVSPDGTESTTPPASSGVGSDLPPGPGPDASEEEKQAFAQTIRERGVETQEVQLEGCKATPLIARVPLGGTLTIVNADDAEHSLQLAGQDVSVGASSQTEFELRDPGIFGLICDDMGAAYVEVTT